MGDTDDRRCLSAELALRALGHRLSFISVTRSAFIFPFKAPFAYPGVRYELGRVAVGPLLSDHSQKEESAQRWRTNDYCNSLCHHPSCLRDPPSLKRLRRSSDHLAEPTLHRFDLNPPDVGSCLSQLQAAFSSYRPRWDWCRQCFTVEEEAKTRDAGDPRRAKLESFRHIYFEHPNCSGGRDTFLHWFPRGLELTFLNSDDDYFPMDGAMRLGLWRWPKEEQDALRALFCRVALNWFHDGGAVPFERVMRETGRDMDTYVSECIVEALLMLRVDPFNLFAWLAREGSPRARDVLVDLTARQHLVDEGVYYVLDDANHEPLLRDGIRALDRLALDSLQRIVTDERLVCLWTWAEREDWVLARTIEDTEPLRTKYALRLSATERRRDRAIVKAAIA